jgi:hypothetical protein
MKLILKAKTVYGKVLVYPVCEQSLLLISLTGKKTLDNKDLSIIKRLGYLVEWKAETVEVA